MASGNASLGSAKKAKNDEFYTQYADIESEMNAYYEYDKDVFRGKTVLCPCDDPEWSNFTKYFASNFERFGLRKLICTSYAKGAGNGQITLFEKSSPLFDEGKHESHGKLYVLTGDRDGSGRVDQDDIEFSGYLEGDGDFRSAEVTELLREADVVATNPPFSLFREFLAWVTGAGKKFAIIGNMNAITYKEVFPMLKDNEMWLGYSIHSGDRKFNVPDDYPLEAAGCGTDPDGRKYIRVKGVRWFTNLDHGQRHDPLMLDTMEHNLKFNKALKKKLDNDFGKVEYQNTETTTPSRCRSRTPSRATTTASWASPSRSWTSTTPSSSKSSDATGTWTSQSTTPSSILRKKASRPSSKKRTRRGACKTRTSKSTERRADRTSACSSR